MTLVLQKTNPELRQIDLQTIFQMYISAIQDLLQADYFYVQRTSENFKIFCEDNNEIKKKIDVNALSSVIENIPNFISEDAFKSFACSAMVEAKFVSILVKIPKIVKDWDIDLQLFASKLVKTVCCLIHSCTKVFQSFLDDDGIDVLFSGLKSLGRPSHLLLSECFSMSFNFEKSITTVGVIPVIMVGWLPEMIEHEQNYVTETILTICKKSLQCKRLLCENKCISNTCGALTNHHTLCPKTIMNLINLIEELAKFNIDSVEVKHVFQLLKIEVNFEYRMQLIETILRISQNRLTLGTGPNEFLDIQSDVNGITVPDIKKWDPSHGFVFHIWLRLDPYETKDPDFNYRRHVFSLTTSSGNGFEFSIQKNGNFVVNVVTKKEVLTATVSSVQLLIGKWVSVILYILNLVYLTKEFLIYLQLAFHYSLCFSSKTPFLILPSQCLYGWTSKIGQHNEIFCVSRAFCLLPYWCSI